MFAVSADIVQCGCRSGCRVVQCIGFYDIYHRNLMYDIATRPLHHIVTRFMPGEEIVPKPANTGTSVGGGWFNKAKKLLQAYFNNNWGRLDQLANEYAAVPSMSNLVETRRGDVSSGSGAPWDSSRARSSR